MELTNRLVGVPAYVNIADKHKPTALQTNEACYKVYHDGGHYIAQPLYDTVHFRVKNLTLGRDTRNMLFNNLYSNALNDGLKGDDLKDYIKSGLLNLFPDDGGIDEYIEKMSERFIANLHKRVKRFKRKMNLNRWNYFVTFTYDDAKHDEESFRRKLRKTLSNLFTRRGWKYIGVFERAPDTGRLHFHGVFYIPDGEMLGKLELKRDYSTASGHMQETVENTFFSSNYGRNDFKELSAFDMKSGRTANYLLKYISKTNEKLICSRGVPSAIFMKLSDDDLAAEMQDYVTKYVLFDDVVDYRKDIVHHKVMQGTVWDLMCNPCN